MYKNLTCSVNPKPKRMHAEVTRFRQIVKAHLLVLGVNWEDVKPSRTSSVKNISALLARFKWASNRFDSLLEAEPSAENELGLRILHSMMYDICCRIEHMEHEG